MKTLKLWTPPVFAMSQPRLDVHVTLRLCTRLLATLPSRFIHPRLAWIFGAHVCSYGELAVVPEVVKEMTSLSLSLPRNPAIYRRSIVYTLHERILQDEVLKGMIGDDVGSVFYLALLGDLSVKVTDLWCEEIERTHEGRIQDRMHVHRFVRAIRNLIEKKTDDKIQEIVQAYVLCLVRYEYVDRVEIALQVMHAPYYVPHYIQARLLLGLSHRDPRWRQEYVQYVSKAIIRCPPEEVERKYKGLYLDLATYVFALRQTRLNYDAIVGDTAQIKHFFQDKFVWCESDPKLRCTLFLTLLTSFTIEFLRIKKRTQYCFTQQECASLLELMNKTDWYKLISVDQFVKQIVLSPEHNPTNQTKPHGNEIS